MAFLVIANPAIITLGTRSLWKMKTEILTSDIPPNVHEHLSPPGKAFIALADTRAPNILPEASTDLLTWTNAAPGLCSDLNANMFFRMRAERM